MRKSLFILLLLCLCLKGFAQKSLLFYNTKKNKTILVKEGNRVSLLYKGYRNQREFCREIVQQITDSTVTLGVDLTQMIPGLRPGKINSLQHKVIRIEDIIGFRKMGAGRQLAKTAVAIGGVVGSFYLLRNVYRSGNISGFNSFLISLGVGVGLVGVNEVLFPENIKFYMEDGWLVKVIDQ